jgi:hypothetical protein
MITDALDEIGPCLSGRLIDYLESQGITRATARQRLRREPSVVAIKGLNFAHGARFIYLPKHHGTQALKKALCDVILATGGAYARAIAAIRARRVVPQWQFAAACGAPLQRKGHLGPDEILQRLTSVGVFIVEDVQGLGPSVAMGDRFNKIPSTEIAWAIARGTVEGSLLETLREWMRKLNLSSWEKHAIRRHGEKPPESSTFAWDMTCPSYLLPLTQWKAGKVQPGFVVCDVFIGNVSRDAMGVFLHKCASLRHLKNLAPVLPIFVADRYDRQALKNARDAGIIAATTQTLFGAEYADAQRELTRVLSNALSGSLAVGQLADIVKRLSKVEGALGNLRGALFEYIVADIARHETAGVKVRMNHRCRGEDGLEVEVDVWLLDDTSTARFIECKSHRPGSTVDDGEIERWLKKRIPAVRHYLNDLSKLQKVPKPVFELWVMGELSDESIRRIDRTRDANKKQFDIDVVNADNVLIRAGAVGNGSLSSTLKQLFIEPAPQA